MLRMQIDCDRLKGKFHERETHKQSSTGDKADLGRVHYLSHCHALISDLIVLVAFLEQPACPSFAQEMHSRTISLAPIAISGDLLQTVLANCSAKAAKKRPDMQPSAYRVLGGVSLLNDYLVLMYSDSWSVASFLWSRLTMNSPNSSVSEVRMICPS